MKIQVRSIVVVVAVLAPLTVRAQQKALPEPQLVSELPATKQGGVKPLRLRLGILGGLTMQKTQLELGAGYDVFKLGERLRLVGDLTVGLRTTEVTFEPMGGVRIPFKVGQDRVELYGAALFGFNLTFLRGGTALAFPMRIAGGMHYELRPGMGIGGEMSLETGPLFAPFFHGYAAAHVTALFALAL